MNFLKSMYISNYMMLAMGIMSHGGWMIYHGANPVAWGGVLLTVAPIMMVIGRLMMFKNVARTSHHFPLLSLQGVIGVGLASWAWMQNPTDTLPLTLAMTGLVGFLFYAYWYSSFGRKMNTKLKIGTILPPFKLLDVNDGVVQSSQLIDRPIIMIFFRGNWCPLCMAQIKEITKKYSEINKM
ncbi:MAG: redoxin domain-containing protein, partial [Magnetovibrio sp.]|nr:redoxin domain-containing protein [Magnetovibrio sp.]